MAKFQWEGTTRAGEKRKGVMEAESASIAEERLRSDGLQNMRVKREGGININIQGGLAGIAGGIQGGLAGINVGINVAGGGLNKFGIMCGGSAQGF